MRFEATPLTIADPPVVSLARIWTASMRLRSGATSVRPRTPLCRAEVPGRAASGVVGRRIRTARWLLGWPQEDAVAKAKLTYRYEHGAGARPREPDHGDLVRPARTFERGMTPLAEVEHAANCTTRWPQAEAAAATAGHRLAVRSGQERRWPRASGKVMDELGYTGLRCAPAWLNVGRSFTPRVRGWALHITMAPIPRGKISVANRRPSTDRASCAASPSRR